MDLNSKRYEEKQEPPELVYASEPGYVPKSFSIQFFTLTLFDSARPALGHRLHSLRRAQLLFRIFYEKESIEKMVEF